MIAFLPRLFRRFRAMQPPRIQAVELQRRLTAGDQVMLLDVREPEEFTGPPGHLPGSINVPLAELAGRTPDLARRKQPIVVVCRPTGARRGQRPTCWLPVFRTSPFSAAAQMAGISEGWRWIDLEARGLGDCIDLVAVGINRQRSE